MKYLSKYTPAEILMIIYEGKPSIKEIFKTTLFDLLTKQVLEITIHEQIKLKHEKLRYYKYLKIGENFNTHISLKHENFYLSPFLKSNSVKIHFRNIVKIAYQNAKSERNLKNVIINENEVKKLFKRNVFHKFIGEFPLNERGKIIKQEIQEEITLLENELLSLISTDIDQVKLIMKTIGGNILLLPKIDLNVLKKIDQDLLNELNKANNIQIESSFDNGYFSDFSNSFESSGSGIEFGGGSFGGGGAGGDFGDSSCSGDSGCGGCGGD